MMGMEPHQKSDMWQLINRINKLEKGKPIFKLAYKVEKLK